LKNCKIILIFLLFGSLLSSLVSAETYSVWSAIGAPVTYFNHLSHNQCLDPYWVQGACSSSNNLVGGRCLSQAEYDSLQNNRAAQLDLWCRIKQPQYAQHIPEGSTGTINIETKFEPSSLHITDLFPTSLPFCNYPISSPAPYSYTPPSFAAYLKVNGNVQCGTLGSCDSATYFSEQGVCCADIRGALNSAGDPDGRCCYDGVTMQSDTSNGRLVCYESQLYGKEEPVPVNVIRIDDGCRLREEGSKFYFNDLDLSQDWQNDGDQNEAECNRCGTNSWNPELSAESCCGDDGQEDTGRIVSLNTIACYGGQWMDTREELLSGQVFKIFTAENIDNNMQTFEYEMLSNGDYWHTCDANSLVPDTKNGIQLPEGGRLQNPAPRELTVSSPGIGPSSDTSTATSLDWEEYLQSGISPSIQASATGTGVPHTSVGQTTTIDNREIAARFICAKEDIDSRFIECCPDALLCVNKDNNEFRLPGSFLNTIKEFTSSAGQPGPYGWGLRTSYLEDVYSLSIFLNDKNPVGSFLADSKLNDWSSFDYIEFFVYAVDDLNLELYIGGQKLQNTNGNEGSHYQTLFNQPILNSQYSSNGQGLQKWIKIRIPVNEIISNNEVNIIELRVNKQASAEDGSDFSIGSVNYHNLIFIDKMHLVKEGTDFVCSGESYNSATRPNLWINDLDSDESACNSIPGNLWSGTQCCGDDINEYYQDGNNYCWNGNLLEEGTAVADFDPNSEDADILYSSNGLLSCSDSKTSVVHGDFSKIVNPVGLSSCNIVEGYVCSPNGKWSKKLYGLYNVVARDTIKSTPDNIESVCCADSQCWTGRACIDASSGIQETTSLDLLAGGNFGDPVLQACVLDRDSSGIWTDVYLAEKWDGSSSAYCPEQTTCWNGERCVFEEESAGDFYCKDGTWSTRTKILATKLLQQAEKESSNEFSLYCDTPENTLPYLDDPTLATFLSEGGANNFCVLKTSSKVILGTSLNANKLEEFAGLVDLNCNDFEAEGDVYGRCVNGNNKLWYNEEYNTVIYSKNNVYIDSIFGDQLFISFIKDPLDVAIELILSVIRPILRGIRGEIQGAEFFTGVRDFNRLYFSKLGSKEVLGVLEQPDPEHLFMSVDYNGFKTDVCKLVNKINVFCQPIISDPDSSYANYKLFSFNTNIDSFEEIWQYATSALRLNSKTFTSFSPPDAEIELPLSGTGYFYNDNIILRVANPEDGVTYYWDTDSSEIINGEFKGVQYEGPAYLLFKTPGIKTISLIAVNQHGQFNLAQVIVTKN